MRIAVLCDVHGNLTALDAVLDELAHEGFDLIVSGGDVAAGPQPRECLERLAALGDRIRWVMGNADREVVSAFDGALAEDPDDPASRSAHFAARRVHRAHRDLLASFAPTVSAGGVLVCHGTPASDTAIVTPRTDPDRLAEAVRDVREPTVVGGHVHLQFLQRSGTVQWVNAGSVGMPYEGAPGAYWLALTSEAPDLRRTAYDVGAAEAAIRATGYPDADDVVAAIAGAVSREEALDAFSPL
ncbi:MAG TPA: metallophosphoesterase family protein [Baekduia sp.]|uniref:metallophosphoesterase family protein n=1 Tax=Baekduia sp. TaxID=2600305 RepID=UPI002BC3F851|nr:metallophosphoesterase family protein [Baekduia sp.]HMJ33242.1 metallophosphoesterase family protein [Baekduia sp.]